MFRKGLHRIDYNLLFFSYEIRKKKIEKYIKKIRILKFKLSSSSQLNTYGELKKYQYFLSITKFIVIIIIIIKINKIKEQNLKIILQRNKS